MVQSHEELLTPREIKEGYSLNQKGPIRVFLVWNGKACGVMPVSLVNRQHVSRAVQFHRVGFVHRDLMIPMGKIPEVETDG